MQIKRKRYSIQKFKIGRQNWKINLLKELINRNKHIIKGSKNNLRVYVNKRSLNG